MENHLDTVPAVVLVLQVVARHLRNNQQQPFSRLISLINHDSGRLHQVQREEWDLTPLPS